MAQDFAVRHVGNPTKALNKLMDRQVFYENFFGRFMSHTETGSSKFRYTFVKSANKYLKGHGSINMHSDELVKGGDYVAVPRAKILDENFRYGDQMAKGYEVDQELMWKHVTVDQVRMAVNVYNGKGSLQRNKEIMTQLMNDVKPALADKFQTWTNHHGLYSALFRGYSNNILSSPNYSSIYSQMSHPNFFYSDGTNMVQASYSAGAYVETPGTSAYENDIADAVDTYSGASTEAMSHQYLLDLRLACIDKKIEPIVTIEGYKFWPMIVAPEIGNQIRALTDFRTYQSRAEEMGKSNPIFSGALGAWDQFVFFEDPTIWAVDKTTPGSAWNATTNPLLYGATNGKPTTTRDTRTIKLGVILGRGAIDGARIGGINFEDEYDDYKANKGLAADIIAGYHRNDYFADVNANTKYALGDFEENDTSLVFILSSDA